MLLRTRWMMGMGAVLAAASAQAASTSRVPVFVNDAPLPADAVMLKNVNRTVLPMRTLFENLGARVEWDPGEQAVYAWKPDGTGVRLALGYRFAQTMRMGGSAGPGNWGTVTGTHRLDAPAMMIGSRVYVPIRFAAEALKADVRFAAYEPAVHIRTERVAGIREEEVQPDRLSLDEERERLRLERQRLEDERLERERNARRARGTREEPRVRTRAIESSISVAVELSRAEVSRDQKMVPLRFLVRNESDRRLALPFATGQQFDIEVLQEGRVIWNWARDRAFTQADTELVMEPGQEKVFTVRWDLRTNRGEKLRPGRYMVRGILTSSFGGRDILAEETITVTE
jgi:hypothetical protein